MHKLVQRKICLFLFIAASLFTSCSFFDNSLENNFSASVSFQINGIKSRSATDTENEVSFLEVMLKGDYEALQTVKIENDKASISFLNIPVGIQVWAEASIYVISGEEKQILYKGKSATVTITAGDNALIIPMKQNTAETPESDSPENTSDPQGTDNPENTGGTSNPNDPANPNGSTDSNGTSEPQEPEIIYVDIYATARTLGADELCDGSEDAPFATIADALSYITSLDNSEENYKIITSGSFAENLIIQNIPAAHLMIEGDGGEVESKITGDGVAGYPLESYQDICLKNITVMANGNLGANIHAGTLTLDGNSKIKCTAVETTGSYGVYVSGSIVMKGSSEISGFKQTSGYTVYVQGASASLVMKNDSKIYDCKTAIGDGQGGGVYVGKGSLEMYDNAKIYNCQSKCGAGVYVYSGSVTMNGHSKITDCTGIATPNTYGVGSYGGGLYIVCESGSSAANATLTMNDYAAIESCTANIGGGVYVNGTDVRSGIVTMNGNSVITTCTGSMINNTNNRYSAGGIDVDSYGKLTMNDNARITDCTGDKSGAGGVYTKGTVEMNGGQISGNETGYYQNMVEYGVGGVDIEAGTFTMKDGEIKSNNGCGCGGVCIGSSATFDMQGGLIGGNTSLNGKASGVMVSFTYSGNTNGGAASSTGTFKISGNAHIEDDNEVTVIYTNGTRKTIPTVVTVSGPLTASGTVARIAFYSVDSSTGSSSLSYYEGDQIISVSNGAGTSFDEILSKFTIKPKVVDSVTTNYMLDGGGKLRIKKAAPDAVGDIVFNDGTAVAYTSGLTFTDSQKADAVCVIFYKGSENGKLGERTLGVGLKQTYGKYWCLGTSNACTPVSNVFEGKTISDLECTCSNGNEIDSSGTTFSGNINGSNNLQLLKAFLAENGGDDTDVSGNYPAWEWANGYGSQYNYSGVFASGWYLPTLAEGAMICVEKYTVNNALEAIGGAEITQTYYWTSNTGGGMSPTFNPMTGVSATTASWDRYQHGWQVCAIREF